MVAAATPKPSAELSRVVSQVANDMASNFVHGENWTPQIQSAMDLVLAGAVDLENRTVKSGDHHYQFDDEYGCTCPDGRLRRRYCKHFTAVEMQRRVDASVKGETMPAKAKKATPQDEWEAGVQGGETSEEPALFDQAEPEPNDIVAPEIPEPDDIPEPEVPENISRAAQEMAEVALDLVEKTVYTKGHQYVDHPSTLCIKRHVGQTEIMWTFRGSLDEEVWGRASRMIRTLDEANKRYVAPATPPQQPAAHQQSQAQTAPAQPTYVDTAAGQIPVCPVHQRTMKPSKYEDGFFCGAKNADDTWCKVKV